MRGPDPLETFSELKARTFIGEELVIDRDPATVTAIYPRAVVVRFDNDPIVQTPGGQAIPSLQSLTPDNFRQHEVYAV